MIHRSEKSNTRGKLAYRRAVDLSDRQNMSMKPFFAEKRAECECFAECGSMKSAALVYQECRALLFSMDGVGKIV